MQPDGDTVCCSRSGNIDNIYQRTSHFPIAQPKLLQRARRQAGVGFRTSHFRFTSVGDYRNAVHRVCLRYTGQKADSVFKLVYRLCTNWLCSVDQSKSDPVAFNDQDGHPTLLLRS